MECQRGGKAIERGLGILVLNLRLLKYQRALGTLLERHSVFYIMPYPFEKEYCQILLLFTLYKKQLQMTTKGTQQTTGIMQVPNREALISATESHIAY
jgi:hypothetical protein